MLILFLYDFSIFNVTGRWRIFYFYGENMSKTKLQKKAMIELLENKFKDYNNFYLVSYKGLNVKDMEDLRKKLKSNQALVYVIKNRLMKKMLEKLSSENVARFSDHLKEPTAVIFGKDDPIKMTNQLLDYSKNNKNFGVKACYIDEECIAGNDIPRIAALVSENALMASVVGTIVSPIRVLQTVLSAPLMNLVMVLKAAQTQKS
ncbi:MAG: 50S ribosomal protein L10 [Elusimicrobia bacterium ADurb.Bin231]|nr:MAG: 50S ribosomal protein L10 [Elusimicrobia bacterium ADurb.Bin231]